MESSLISSVTPFELAVLVLNYLDCTGWKKTSQTFRREARLVLGSAAHALPAGVKNLSELLNEYVSVREQDARRQRLQSSNPVAQSLYSLLDFHAGLPTPQCLPPAFYPEGHAPLTMPTAQQASQQQTAQGGTAVPPAMVPVQAADLSYPPQHQEGLPLQEQPGVQPAGQQGTPSRHIQRKGAPRKRRKLEDSFNLPSGGACFGWQGSAAAADCDSSPARQQQQLQQDPGDRAAYLGSVPLPCLVGDGEDSGMGMMGLNGGGLRPTDLLNMPLDEDALMSLLCDDDLQNRFASGLAQHITTALNHQPSGVGHGSLGPSPSRSDGDPLLGPSIEDVLAELPTDPAMAQLLQQFVRCEAVGFGSDGQGGLMASPPTVDPDPGPAPPPGGPLPGSNQGAQQGKTRRVQPQPPDRVAQERGPASSAAAAAARQNAPIGRAGASASGAAQLLPHQPVATEAQQSGEDYVTGQEPTRTAELQEPVPFASQQQPAPEAVPFPAHPAVRGAAPAPDLRPSPPCCGGFMAALTSAILSPAAEAAATTGEAAVCGGRAGDSAQHAWQAQQSEPGVAAQRARAAAADSGHHGCQQGLGVTSGMLSMHGRASGAGQQQQSPARLDFTHALRECVGSAVRFEDGIVKVDDVDALLDEMDF